MRYLAAFTLLLIAACGSEPREASTADAAPRDAPRADAGHELADAGLVDGGETGVCLETYFACRADMIAATCPDGGDTLCQQIADGRCLVDRCTSTSCASTCDRTECGLACHRAADDGLEACRAACTDASGCGCGDQVRADRTACDGNDACTTLLEIVSR